MARLTYIGSCVHLDGHTINDMKDDALEITRATFLKHINREEFKELEADLGYDRHPKQGLTMAGDAYVGYYRSHYEGCRVYYFDQSGIEHVFG